MQIKTAVILCFQPFFCRAEVVPLLHLIENLVESEQLVVGFPFFIQETTDILIRGVGVGINGHIGHILINKAIDEI